MKHEWHNAPDFAEVAETLGVNTVDVMALLPEQTVLYTPSPNDEDPDIYVAQLFRDRDGILCHGPRRLVGSTSQFQDKVKELVAKAMEWSDDEEDA